IYVPGRIFPDIRVAMREISLSPTRLTNGETEMNAPVAVYDPSGPYTDENAQIDVRQGLPKLREPWIRARADVEELPGISSVYGR
ncbi:phosphomethylpyrimidine synthase ThiC, partial [Klebsiella pneumoniae]|nr:phosphomethylpyrimidine synthase ThiC [Klebsiella pneumoniae]